MKIKLHFTAFILVFIISNQVNAEYSVSTNRNPIGLETNILFNATNRYSVSQTGPANVDLERLFDGNFSPSYSSAGPSTENPQIILIENLPAIHRQCGAWIGLTTRYWPINHFKLEVYNTWEYPAMDIHANTWMTIADYSTTTYGTSDFISEIPYVVATKIRLTIYSGAGPNSRYGISEIYFLHPEAGRIYSGLIPTTMWEVNGNVGIGTKAPGNYKLNVAGILRANEIVVDLALNTKTINTNELNLKSESWADYVFKDDFILKPLTEVESFIKKNKHLPDVPSENEIKKDGLNMSKMTATQMKKIEELTLHLIEQNKQIAELTGKIERFENDNRNLK